MPSAFLKPARLHPACPERGWAVSSAERLLPFAASTRERLKLILLIAILSLFSASCHRRIRARLFVPPPPPPQRPFVLPPKPEIPQPPEIEARVEVEIPGSDTDIPLLPPPPEPPKRPVIVAVPKPTPPPPAPEPAPSPRLGQIFTADQLREYNRSIEESMSRARSVLAVAAGRRLNQQQSEMVTRIRTFLMQAEQARPKDLVTAVNLARRADLLARDLSGSFP